MIFNKKEYNSKGIQTEEEYVNRRLSERKLAN